MANQTNNNKLKLAVGYILTSLSLVLLILSCIPKLAIANFFIGIFGVAWYAYLVLGMLFGVACIMQLKYVFNKKFTASLIVAMFAIICLLHTIFSHATIVSFDGFSNFEAYLSTCMHLTNGITVGGAAAGVFAYLLKCLLGTIGLYCTLIMMFSISFGVILDSLIYGHAKKKKQQFVSTKTQTTKPVEQFQPINQQPVAAVNEPVVEEEPNIVFDEEESEEDNSYSQFSQSRQDARDRLYPNRQTTSYSSEGSTPRSARDVLFGNRSVPDITMQNDQERDRWMRHTAEELNVEDEEEDDVNSLFGSTDIETNTTSTNLYERNFPSRPIANDDSSTTSRFGAIREQRAIFNSEDDNEDSEEETINPRVVPQRNFGSRNIFGQTESMKLGEDEDDVAKPQEINFQARSSVRQPKPVQGKQMGIKSVRYNSIPLSIFKAYTETNADYSEEYRRKSAALEKVMENFNIGAKVINVVRGPKVTRYELSLPDGINVQNVIRLEKNISMALAAKSEIRIEAPIPGKNAFGIELENDVSSIVGMRELLESPEYTKTTNPLPIAIGKDINGKVIIKSLPKMIHLLVAGSSGSGKSVFIHALMMSILYKYSPEDVRFIMIDPKRVEFTMYNNLPHLMLPKVVYEHDKALNAIKWAVDEMMRRYEALQNNECQNIEQYNKLPEITSHKTNKMPYLIIVVDELAELMGGVLKKDFEAGIQRITQLGRAAGIHMVVATQRPSVDVVTGTIKNNMPTRVAFALSSAVDSKTVLDIGGAEKLLGQGDMLFAPQDQNSKIRLQAALCSNDEIRNALKYIKENNEAVYDEEVVNIINAEKKEEPTEGTDALGNGGDIPNSGMDEFMKMAINFARSTGKVSASMLQRKFRIGFNRAARIVDQMVEFGLVGPSVGSKPRDFAITNEQYRELFGEDIDDSIF